MIITKEQFKQSLNKVCNPLPGSIPASTPYRLSVKQKYNGLNIVDFFLAAIPGIPKEKWITKINEQQLFIDDKVATINSTVNAGNVTRHYSEPKTEPFVNSNIGFIFCDENIIVLNKPAPLPMHPSGRFNKNSLTELLQLAFPNEDFKIIHRLDANTTGIIVLGRNANTVREIGKQFEENTTTKKYMAIVEGIPSEKHFSSSTAISLEKTPAGGRKINKDGIDAHTDFEVLETYTKNNTALLSITPHSGRTNQIRLHLADLNFPILGDLGYKDPIYFENNPLTYKDDCLYLHAYSLTFLYKGQETTFVAELPEKFGEKI